MTQASFMDPFEISETGVFDFASIRFDIFEMTEAPADGAFGSGSLCQTIS